ncbi:hypothetical protein PAXRUDRAFT_148082, partial [Paxillus rubicundulus Ve08.2h10]
LPRLSSTDAEGSTVFVTTTFATVVPTIVDAPTSSGSSNTNLAAIIGGTVGGVVGLVIFALFLFCIRKRSKKDEFDGDFDPDRVVGHSTGGGTLPQVDLTDDVTPFPQQYGDYGGGSMRQYGDSPYLMNAAVAGAGAAAGAGAGMPGGATSPLTSPSRYSDATSYHQAGGPSSAEGYPQNNQFMRPGGGPPPGGYQQPVNMYGAGPADWFTPQPMISPPPSTVASTTATSRSAKEREALARNGEGTGTGTGLALATQHEVAEGSGEVVVHQDAGRAPSDGHHSPNEIPPAYESISQ